ncbi:microtubule-actin cross-linking factor 1, isoforms 6/7-like [Macrotis lagotis]|uniref:microtubule-actin cross-linking factor 1, isoforms 6/7-like n=1 Tax=Macrotis lagotis TaxID=92651 RepID=UPI003D682BFA
MDQTDQNGASEALFWLLVIWSDWIYLSILYLAVLQAEADRLWDRWSGLQTAAQERANWLRVVLALAEQFWQGLTDLATSLADTQHLVLHMEDAGPEPEGIRSRLGAMQALREEVDGLQSELDALGALGLELLSACGDGDRPEVTRSMDELYASWNSLSRVWTERHRHLEEQLQDALSYQEAMQARLPPLVLPLTSPLLIRPQPSIPLYRRLLSWLEGAELRLGQDFRVGGTLELAKQQLEELKDFKRELYQSRVEVESLRHRPAPGGPEDPSPPPLLGDFRLRWDHLEQETGSRQQQLEAALLGLGQLQPQLEELVQWLGHTAEQLQGAPAVVSLDLPSCEIELAKLQVLQNDVLSRAQTVQSVSEAAQGLLQAGLGEAEAGLRAALQTLDQRWEAVQGEIQSRQLQLENSRAQLQDVELGMAELLQWLEQVDLGLVLIKPSWGPPDPPQERLARHLELCRELEQKQPEYEGLRQRRGRQAVGRPVAVPAAAAAARTFGGTGGRTDGRTAGVGAETRTEPEASPRTPEQRGAESGRDAGAEPQRLSAQPGPRPPPPRPLPTHFPGLAALSREGRGGDAPVPPRLPGEPPSETWPRPAPPLAGAPSPAERPERPRPPVPSEPVPFVLEPRARPCPARSRSLALALTLALPILPAPQSHPTPLPCSPHRVQLPQPAQAWPPPALPHAAPSSLEAPSFPDPPPQLPGAPVPKAVPLPDLTDPGLASPSCTPIREARVSCLFAPSSLFCGSLLMPPAQTCLVLAPVILA